LSSLWSEDGSMLSKRYSTALVTGGAHGIGRAIAAALVAEGIALAIVDRDGDAAAATAKEIHSGGRCLALTADVTDAVQVQEVCGRAEELLGAPIDILVNNAGIVVGGRFADTTLADTTSQIDVNLLAPIRLIHLLLPGMLARRRGQIVNIASAGGLASNPGIAVYCTTKFGLVGFSESLRSELAGTGVGVSVICPGAIRTGIARRGVMRGLPQARVDALMAMGGAPTRVARATMHAIRRNRALTVVTVHAMLGTWWCRHFPRSYRGAMAVVGRIQRKEIAAARAAGPVNDESRGKEIR
jgi:short-subunit dehydrogenase